MSRIIIKSEKRRKKKREKRKDVPKYVPKMLLAELPINIKNWPADIYTIIANYHDHLKSSCRS